MRLAACLPVLGSFFPSLQTSSREIPAPVPLACLEMGLVVGQLPRWPTFPRRTQPCLAVGAGGAAAWVYLELLLAVPGPRASRISSSQLSRKPGLSAAKRDKNSFSCLLTALGKGAGTSPSPYCIFVSGSLGTGPEMTPTSSKGLAAGTPAHWGLGGP